MMFLLYRNTHDKNGNWREEEGWKEHDKEKFLNNPNARFIHLLDPEWVCKEKNIYCNFDNLVSRIILWNQRAETEDAKMSEDVSLIMKFLGEMISLGVVTIGVMA